MNINPVLLIDGYKTSHRVQYPNNTEYVYSNFTPRQSRIKGIDKIVFFGLQYFIKEYLIKQWNDNFFNKDKETILKSYKRRLDNYLGPDSVSIEHIAELHDLGFLPIKIKALKEGKLVPVGVPVLTIINTIPKFFWLTNYLESLMSNILWKPITSATTAFQYRLKFNEYSEKTGYPKEVIQWQGHDFSFRGMSGIEDGVLSGAGHLLSFTGTDTIPAIDFMEEYYYADSDKELVGGSISASEHSVMSMGSEDNEINTFKRFITDLYPNGLVAIVSDTWDFWKVLTEYLPELKEDILKRDGRLVIRPDSGDPVKIICGNINIVEYNGIDNINVLKEYAKSYIMDFIRDDTPHGECGESEHTEYFRFENKIYEITVEIEWNRYDKQYYFIDGSKVISCEEFELTAEEKGAYEVLWDLFGGTINEKGYKELNTKIGLIYGDSITLKRQDEILKQLEAKGFSASNLVLGIGSYTYEYVTRDTFGFAMKATWGQVDGIEKDIFKNPKTNSGFKKSAKGLLMVTEENGELKLKDQCTKEEENSGLLETVFENSILIKDYSLSEIRETIKNQF